MFNSNIIKVITLCNILVISSLLCISSLAVDMNPNMPILGTIKGTLFFDANKNGINDDPVTRSFAGVFMNVLRNPGTTQAQYMVQEDGKYEFAVLPGSYKVQFVLPKGTIPTTKGTLDNLNDSDINPDWNSDYVEVTEAKRIVIVNAGVIDDIPLPPKPAIIGDYIWLDTNKNGKQDSSEKGIPGVVVNAYLANSKTVIATTSSDSKGYYSFKLPANTYDFRFYPPKNYTPTTKNTAFNNNDSNIDNSSTILGLSLFADEVNNDYDAGYIEQSPKPPSIKELIVKLNKFISDYGNSDILSTFDKLLILLHLK
jgi:SdrD B-like domain